MKPTRTCSIDGCDKKHRAKGYCPSHYTAHLKHGDASVVLRPRHDRTVCEVAGCGKPRRKREWCGTHYQRWRKNGSPDDAAQAWVVPETPPDCLVCGRASGGEYGVRRYCSSACKTLHHRSEYRPRYKKCIQCGADIDLLSRGQTGRRKYSSASCCDKCAGSPNMARFIPVLVARDGTGCGICGDGIDMTLVYPDPMSRSVDHVIPRSKGGANAIHNYQLSHLRCNIRKQNRA